VLSAASLVGQFSKYYGCASADTTEIDDSHRELPKFALTGCPIPILGFEATKNVLVLHVCRPLPRIRVSESECFTGTSIDPSSYRTLNASIRYPLHVPDSVAPRLVAPTHEKFIRIQCTRSPDSNSTIDI